MQIAGRLSCFKQQSHLHICTSAHLRITTMHAIEPFYNWRHLYIAEEDERSPFYGREYSEFEFTNQVYNFLIHPQWDEFGSPTLYMKILYADYELKACIIELLGEWNDALN